MHKCTQVNKCAPVIERLNILGFFIFCSLIVSLPSIQDTISIGLLLFYFLNLIRFVKFDFTALSCLSLGVVYDGFESKFDCQLKLFFITTALKSLISV